MSILDRNTRKETEEVSTSCSCTEQGRDIDCSEHGG